MILLRDFVEARIYEIHGVISSPETKALKTLWCLPSLTGTLDPNSAVSRLVMMQYL